MGAARSEEEVTGIILAAGRGARMRSAKTKPLHRVAGKELVKYPVQLLTELGAKKIVAVVSDDNLGQMADLLEDQVEFAVQRVPRGTADAVCQGLRVLPGETSTIVVVSADTPLVRAESVQAIISDHLANPERRMTILSVPEAFAPDLGRVQRAMSKDGFTLGAVTGIVEAADSEGPKFGPAEVNTGVYCFDGKWLSDNIGLVPAALSGELYLTALASIGAHDGADIAALPVALPDEAMGINDRAQLAAAEVALRDRINCYWMTQGVTIVDPATTYIDYDVQLGMDTVLMPNTMLTGCTSIGNECEIGPNSVIADTIVGDRCRVVGSVLEGSRLEAEVEIGPFSHLRPGAVIETGVHLGNFVEVKNSRLGAQAAAGHFCYLGDADVGASANIGAGTITCNYDGIDKHRTVIGDGAFIGSDTMLVAPIEVGANAATGAGAVVINDIPESRRAVGVPARLLPQKKSSA